MIFLVFPVLNSKENIYKSREIYIKPLIKNFKTNCKKNDFFFDVSTFLNDFSDKVIVNKFNFHPSTELHNEIALIIDNIINKKNYNVSGLFSC